MDCCRKLAVLFTWAFLGATAMAVPTAQEKQKSSAKSEPQTKKGKEKDKSSGNKAKEKDKKGKDGDQSSAKMSLPIPKGHDSKGLKIPYYDEDGKLQMTFNIGLANRVDDDHVRMKELQIETFDDGGDREMTIDVPNSMLDLNSRVITAKESVTIRRSDFEITGKTMEFNTQTKNGRLGGSVRMLIYNLEEETSPESPTDTKKEEKAQ